MRAHALALVAVLLVGCGDAGSAGTPPIPSGGGPAATTIGDRDCTVSWARYYKTLAELVEDSPVIVRATPLVTDRATLYAFDGSGARFSRDARRTTFRVTKQLKGPALSEVYVVEDVCENIETRPGEAWLILAHEFAPPFAPGPGYYVASGGPQGQFRLVNGRVAGTYFVFAPVVRSYDGISVDRLAQDIAAVVH